MGSEFLNISLIPCRYPGNEWTTAAEVDKIEQL